MAKKTISLNILQKVKRLKQNLESEKVPVNQIYLFGSQAKGTAHKWSDIDLCIISPAFGKKIKNPFNYLWSKRLEFDDFTISPIGFSPQDFRGGGDIIDEIKRTGIKIKV